MPSQIEKIERRSFPLEVVSQTTLEDFLQAPHGPIEAISTSYYQRGSEVVCKIDFQSKLFFQFPLTNTTDAEHAADHISKYISNFKFDSKIKGFGIAFGKTHISVERIIYLSKTWRVLPENSPELWPGARHTSENLADFFRRVWAKYIPHGLSLEKLKELDPSLRHAIKTHMKNRVWPDDLRLPNMRADLDRAEERFKKFGTEYVSPKELIAIARRRERRRKASLLSTPQP